MDTIARSPYIQLHFNKNGELTAGTLAEVQAALAADGVEDLVVLSHGWKFEGEEPRALYNGLWPKAAASLARDAAKVVVIGVVWPSKRFATSIDEETVRISEGGGALAVDEGSEPADLPDEVLEKALSDAIDTFKTAEADPELHAAVQKYRDDPTLPNVEALLKSVARRASLATEDPELSDEADRFERSVDDVGDTLAIFADPPSIEPGPEAAGTLGLGVGELLRGVFRGPRAALVRVLEQASYFEMKERAGTVGRGVGKLLGQLRPDRPTRLHLVGHSFGARLVTAAAHSFEAPPDLELFSITLLQGAFSHNGLSKSRGGAFQALIGKPSGPIVITHTHNDSACTIAYALASRLSRDAINRIGDADDAFGSMGANGAQFLEPQATVTNVRADGFIRDHNDIRTDRVGALIAEAIEAPPQP